MKPLTDEQLSMVLSAHAEGLLHARGVYDWEFSSYYTGFKCRGANLLQVVLNEPHYGVAADADYEFSKWWEANYQPTWTEEELLEQLKEHGAA